MNLFRNISNYRTIPNYDDDDDLAYIPFPNTIWIVKNNVEYSIKVCLMLLVIIGGVFGNVALINVILRGRNLKTPTNLLIANMAFADLFQLLICTWMFLIEDLYQNYILGEYGCKLQGFLECSLLLTNVINLCGISYDRLTAIVLPKEKLTLRKAKVLMVISWTIGFILAMPLITGRIYHERKWLNFLEEYCTEEKIYLPIYWNILLSLLVWVPLAVMFICYSAIFIKLDRYEHKVLKSEHPITANYKKKIAKMVFIILITFILCRTPFTAIIFIRQNLSSGLNQVNNKLKLFVFLSKYLIFLNAALNPIIYGLKNENFLRVLRTMTITKWMFCQRETKETNTIATNNIIYNIYDQKLENSSQGQLVNLYQIAFRSTSLENIT